MNQAKPSDADFERVLFFFQGIESILEESRLIESRDDPGRRDFDELDVMDWLESQWKHVGPAWQRVLWAGKVAIDNTCQPNADVLKLKPDIAEAIYQASLVPVLKAQLEEAKRVAAEPEPSNSGEPYFIRRVQEGKYVLEIVSASTGEVVGRYYDQSRESAERHLREWNEGERS